MLSLKYLIVSLSDAYCMIIFVYVLLSWFPTDRGILADINNVLARVCDPYSSASSRQLAVWWTLRPSSRCLYYNSGYVCW